MGLRREVKDGKIRENVKKRKDAQKSKKSLSKKSLRLNFS